MVAQFLGAEVVLVAIERELGFLYLREQLIQLLSVRAEMLVPMALILFFLRLHLPVVVEVASLAQMELMVDLAVVVAVTEREQVALETLPL